MKELRTQALCARDVLGAAPAAFLEVPDHRVLELVAVLLQERPDLVEEADRAQRLEGLGGAGEVGFCVFDRATEVFEDFFP